MVSVNFLFGAFRETSSVARTMAENLLEPGSIGGRYIPGGILNKGSYRWDVACHGAGELPDGTCGKMFLERHTFGAFKGEVAQSYQYLNVGGKPGICLGRHFEYHRVPEYVSHMKPGLENVNGVRARIECGQSSLGKDLVTMCQGTVEHSLNKRGHLRTDYLSVERLYANCTSAFSESMVIRGGRV